MKLVKKISLIWIQIRFDFKENEISNNILSFWFYIYKVINIFISFHFLFYYYKTN